MDAPPPRELGQQPLERLEGDPGLVPHRRVEHREPLVHGEERLLDGLTATATTTRSARARLRRIRSSWPFVGGSNEPG